MTPTPEPLHPPGTEIARLKLPVPASALFALTKALEKTYGKGLRLKPDGAWFSLVTPTAEDLELDRRHARSRRQASRSNAAQAPTAGGAS